MFLFKKKLIKNSDIPEIHDLKERLFFHDIINHTHGLVLFLNQKEIGREIIDLEEIKMISSEIKTLQSLIRDHFEYKHKNLVQTLDWVPFSYAKLAFNSLSQTYLTEKKVTTTFDVEGQGFDENLIYYPSYYRILNNLIKNISESNSTHVQFKIKITKAGLEIITKNEMKVKNEKNLPEHLSRVILNEKPPKVQGLGLESIHHLAEENGGTFSFEITDSVWTNKLFLPTAKTISDKIPA
ncbi:MAG: GHKL domain-containing protein [Bacteriovorax sp.]|nr:GHKL domain-containing protein [Bacteriovorax sp.]